MKKNALHLAITMSLIPNPQFFSRISRYFYILTMKAFLGLLLILGKTVSGQYHFVLHLTNEDLHQPIAGASVRMKGMNKGGITDSMGWLRTAQRIAQI